MVKKRMNQTAIWNKLKQLEKVQEEKDAIPVIFMNVEESGKISLGVVGNQRLFDNAFEAENTFLEMPGITSKTVIFVDDMIIFPDMYLPLDPLLYYITPEERKQFIGGYEKPDEWLQSYIKAIDSILLMAIKTPDMFLPGFDDLALKDLIENRGKFTIQEMVDRYKDQKWFNKVLPLSRTFLI